MSTSHLRIEFAPGARRVAWFGLSLLMVMAFAVAISGIAAWRAWEGRQQALANLETLQSRRVDATRPKPVKTDLAAVSRERTAQAVSKTLMTPWARLLESLGSTGDLGVALLSMEPSVAKRSVRLTAEARNWESMLRYLAALQHDGRLSAVSLVSHQLQQQAPGTPIRFVVQAEWGGEPS